MIFIDGKSLPASGKSMLSTGLFIAQNLRPDSEISYIDLEGGDFTMPSYDSLMDYAQICLGVGFTLKRQSPFKFSSYAIRAAVAKVCVYELKTSPDTSTASSQYYDAAKTRFSLMQTDPLITQAYCMLYADMTELEKRVASHLSNLSTYGVSYHDEFKDAYNEGMGFPDKGH